MRKVVRLILVVLGLAGGAARGDDWPQFLGPRSHGISGEKGLSRSWPTSGPSVLWTRELADGWGGASVRDKEVYLLDRLDGRQDVLRCLDLQTGRELWSFAYDAPGAVAFDGTRTVPLVDEKFVYTIGALGHIYCIDRTTHKAVWSAHLVDTFRTAKPTTVPATNPVQRTMTGMTRGLSAMRPQLPKWGVTHHPVLYKDLLIVAPLTNDVGLAAFEKSTGKVVWRSSYLGRNWFSYASPYLTKLLGQDQIIVVANDHHAGSPPAIISAVDPADGKLLWHIKTWKRYNVPIPMPVKAGDDKLFVAGGYRIGCFMLKVSRADERWSVEYAFRDNDNCTPHVQTPIVYGGFIYANSFDGYHNTSNNGLVCLDLEGNLKWKTGPDTLFDGGNLIIADKLIYIMDGATGTLHLYEATPEAAKELASAKVLDAPRKEAWAPMALSDGKLIIRDRRTMKCLAVGQ